MEGDIDGIWRESGRETDLRDREREGGGEKFF